MNDDGQELLFRREELFDLTQPASPETEEAAREAETTEGPLKRLIDGNFLQYASYVIRDRAIPDIDDGLKPVQRRILHSLFRTDDKRFTKVANIVGHTMQFHPHGDASIGDALVNLVNKRYLVEGQGNFGNALTGDPPAAARYIECRLTELARSEVFNKDLTDFVPTYDGRNEEPVALPSKLPLLLMMGAEGIAVGISTRILPHNFSELIEAQIAILNKKSFMILPDFQQGGVMDASGYDAGRGQIKIRALVEKKDAATLVIREIPFGATSDSVIASVEDAARKNKIKIKSIDDFTAGNVEIEVRLQPEEDADRAIEALYAFTMCQVQLSSRVVVIRARKPLETTVDDILGHNTERLLAIVKKELGLERRRLGEELHRRTLVRIFIENRIYKEIEKCKTPEEVEATVLAGVQPFRAELVRDITAKDIEMLLEIPIRRISLFDLEKNRAEMEQIKAKIAEAESNLRELVPYVIRYLRGLIRKYGDAFPRKTRLEKFEAVAVRDITATELTIGYDREKGYLGWGVRGETLMQCSSYDKLMLFWKDGRYKVLPPPEKLFTDPTVIKCMLTDRARTITIVYREDLFVYAKRFIVGGTIMNKEYRSIPKGCEVLLFADDNPPEIYVKYGPEENQKIFQQQFDTADLPVREAKSRGIMMTSKKIAAITVARPTDWNDKKNGPRGAFMEFR